MWDKSHACLAITSILFHFLLFNDVHVAMNSNVEKMFTRTRKIKMSGPLNLWGFARQNSLNTLSKFSPAKPIGSEGTSLLHVGRLF